MRRPLFIAISILLLLGLVVIMVVLRRSRPEETARPTEKTRLAETLPTVSPPPKQPTGEYDARIHGDEDSVPEDWFAKHPLYSSLPAAEDGFSIQPTGKLFELKVTLEPRAPLNTPEREAELKALQQRALTWMKKETLKVDPSSQAAKAYPGWAEKQPAFGFDQRRGITDFTIIWQQSR